MPVPTPVSGLQAPDTIGSVETDDRVLVNLAATGEWRLAEASLLLPVSDALTPADYGVADGVCQLDGDAKVPESNLKLASGYTVASTLAGTEKLVIEQSGGWRQATISAVVGALSSLAYTGVVSVPTARVLGRGTSGTGAAEALTLGTYLNISAGALVVDATSTPTAGKIAVADGSGKLDGWITAGTTSAAGLLQLGTTSGKACDGGDSRLSDSRTPTAHATSHKSGGGDAIRLDELAAPTDVTTLNASTSAHGLLKKLSNASTEFLNGQGNWATPSTGITTINSKTGATVTLVAGDISDVIGQYTSSPIKPKWAWCGSADELAALTLPAGVPMLLFSYADLFVATVESATLPATSTTAVNVTTANTVASLGARFLKRLSSRPGIAGPAGPVVMTAVQDLQTRVQMTAANTLTFTPDRRGASAEAADALVQVVDYVGPSGGAYELIPVGTVGGIYGLAFSGTNETATLALGLTLSAGERNKVLIEVLGSGGGGATARQLGICVYLSNTTTLAGHGPPPASTNGMTHDVSLVLAKGSNWRVRYALGAELGAGDTGNLTIYDGQPVGWNTTTNAWDITGLNTASVSNWERAFIWSAEFRGPEDPSPLGTWVNVECGPLVRKGTTSDATALGSVNYEFPAAHGQTTQAAIVCILEDISPASSVTAMKVLRVESSNATGTAYPTGAVVVTPRSAGTYEVGDVLTAPGGSFTVSGVDTAGGVTSVDLLAAPGTALPITLNAADATTNTTDGTATGCTLRIAYDFHVDISSLDLLEPEGALPRVSGITETTGTTTIGFGTHLVSAKVIDRKTLLVRRPLRSAVVKWVAQVARLPRPSA